MEQLTAAVKKIALNEIHVRDELNNILTNKLFSSSPILCRFLEFVVEHTLAGKENELKEYTIGIQVLGKSADFNSGLDASVRIHANRLRKLLKTYYEENSNGSLYRIELPTGHYRPVFKRVHQDTNGNIATGIVKNHRNILQKDGYDLCIIPFSSFFKGSHKESPGHLPCDMLHKKLSLFQDISLIPQERVLKYFKKGGKLTNIGKMLGTKYYLSGNIDIEDDITRVSVSLFKATTNEFVVTISFEGKTTEGSFAGSIDHITSKIASSIADYSGLIHIQNFALAGVVPPSNIVSHAAFWHYKYLTNNRKEIFMEALVQMKAAVREYPGSALSWAVLGHLLADGVVYNYLPAKPTLEQALFAAEKSLYANPECQHGHTTMGWIMVFFREAEKAIYHFKRSISINPHSTYFKTTAGLGLAMAGDYESSLSHVNSAMKLNPIPGWWANLPYVFVYLKEKEFEKMLFYSRKIATPSVVFEHVFEMIALYYLGKKNQVIKILKAYKKINPGGLEFVITALPAVVLDEGLVNQMVTALHQIKKWEQLPA